MQRAWPRECAISGHNCVQLALVVSLQTIRSCHSNHCNNSNSVMSVHVCRCVRVICRRSGAIRKHDTGLLPRSHGGLHRVWRDAAHDLRGRHQVEGGPGLQANARRRQEHRHGAAGQQVRPGAGTYQQRHQNGPVLQGPRLRGLVRDVGQGEWS